MSIARDAGVRDALPSVRELLKVLVRGSIETADAFADACGREYITETDLQLALKYSVLSLDEQLRRGIDIMSFLPTDENCDTSPYDDDACEPSQEYSIELRSDDLALVELHGILL